MIKKTVVKSIGLTPLEMIVETQSLQYVDFNSLRTKFIRITLAKLAHRYVN